MARIYEFENLDRLVTRLRDDVNNKNFILIYAYNGIGKTRLSMKFKDKGKNEENNTRDTLYFNAFTEDLFRWDNDLDNDLERKIHLNKNSKFFNGFRELVLEEKISNYYRRYASVDFRINYDEWTISFYNDEQENIKISRGEETIFIWCIFMAICELAIDEDETYDWVKYIYIDDPISSLDDNNAIAVACDLAKLLLKIKYEDETDKVRKIKTVISSHHSLFFNVICNELKITQHKKYFLHKNKEDRYALQATDDTPFFHHVATLSELKNAINSGKLYTYHFNAMRNILEKTATFFGLNDFSECLKGIEDEQLFARALNVLSHGKYSIFEPMEMQDDNKSLFENIFNSFLENYHFNLPELSQDSRN